MTTKEQINNKIHKEGFNAGYNKALKDVDHIIHIIIGYIGGKKESDACLNRWETLRPKDLNKPINYDAVMKDKDVHI